MLRVTHCPQVVNDKGELVFEGQVELDKPLYLERLRILKETGLQIGSGGEVVGNNLIDQQIKLVEAIIPLIKKVDVVRLEDKYRFTSMDELQADEDGVNLINEMSIEYLIKGGKLGKFSSKK